MGIGGKKSPTKKILFLKFQKPMMMMTMVLELEWNADLDQTSAANAMLESKFFNYAK